MDNENIIIQQISPYISKELFKDIQSAKNGYK